MMISVGSNQQEPQIQFSRYPRRADHAATVRQLLAHQAGLFAIDEPVDRSVVADLDRMTVVLARQKPAWEPGTRQGYHALTLSSPPADMSWAYAKRRWTCWPPPPFRRRADFMTNSLRP